MVRLLFVCTGNICRSPTAEGVARELVAGRGLSDRIEVDSAGTHGYHVGDPPDSRSQAAAARRGIDLSGQRARQVVAEDFDAFSLLLAMDRGHERILQRASPPGTESRVRLFLDYAPDLGHVDVPDPYYGGGDGFEIVLDLVEAASRGLIDAIEKEYRFG